MNFCCKCGKAANFHHRIAIPAVGMTGAQRWLHTSETYCHAHRKEAPKASEFLTSDVQEFIIVCMKPAQPDFAKASIEWASL